MDLFTTFEFRRVEFDLPNADILLYENFFTLQESNNLYRILKETIAWQQDQIVLYGKNLDLPRLTAWYGNPEISYAYAGISMAPTPWNEALKFIKARIEQEANVVFTGCLLNLYRSGMDSMGWHQDNEAVLGLNPIIGSVSFGETRPLQLKHTMRKDLEKIDIPLTHGSFLLMKGEMQHFWKHQIPKTTKDIQPRINLTFRII